MKDIKDIKDMNAEDLQVEQIREQIREKRAKIELLNAQTKCELARAAAFKTKLFDK
jgi:hypothetical protein